jgi:hypothetical protein
MAIISQKVELHAVRWLLRWHGFAYHTIVATHALQRYGAGYARASRTADGVLSTAAGHALSRDNPLSTLHADWLYNTRSTVGCRP